MANQTATSTSKNANPLDNRTLPPMGMTSTQFHTAGVAALSEIEQYYNTLSTRPVLPSIQPGYLSALLPTTPPLDPEPWPTIASDISRVVLPGMTHWQHPAFMAFFPASSTYPAMLGELWSAALTAPAFNWICSPAVTELETVVLDWVAEMLGLDMATFGSKGEGGGVIQGSASEAIVTVMVAARERYVRGVLEREGVVGVEEREDRAGEVRGRLVALASDQAHSSSQKAANIAGVRFRSIATRKEDDYALKGDVLRAKIEELHGKGLYPFYLTVSLGTTGTCAVDDFIAIAEVQRDYPDLWIHCDAAYAGAALVLPEYQHLSQQLSFVDSFDMNMHKWLLTNFDASCLFVRRRRDLIDALSITPSYLKNQFTDSGFVTDYRDWQIPLGRRFRSLKIWFVIRTWGVRGLQEHIRHHIALGELFADLVRSRNDLFEVLVPPAFALTVFTVKPSAASTKSLQNGANGTDDHVNAANSITKQVFSLVDQRKDIFLTSSVINGVYAIRVVSANPMAEEKYVREIFDIIVAAVEEVRADRDGLKDTKS